MQSHLAASVNQDLSGSKTFQTSFHAPFKSSETFISHFYVYLYRVSFLGYLELFSLSMPMLLEVVEFWCQYFDRRKFEEEFSRVRTIAAIALTRENFQMQIKGLLSLQPLRLSNLPLN